MKRLLTYLFLTIFYLQSIVANSLMVTNITSGQISITVQTPTQKASAIAPANMNPILNDINEPDPNPIIINFDNNQVEKISISRFESNMPQVIYYDGQNTHDANQQIGGLKSLNLQTKNNKIIVWKEYVEINNVIYPSNSLDSYTVRANTLKNQLSATNIKDIQTKVNDLNDTLKLVSDSDMAPQLSIQIINVQSIIDTITTHIKILKTLQQYLEKIQDLEKNLALGNNNFTGTNKPYKPADDSIDQAIKTLQSLHSGLNTLKQANVTDTITDQMNVVQTAMNQLQSKVDQLKTQKFAISHEMLVPNASNLQTFQNS